VHSALVDSKMPSEDLLAFASTISDPFDVV
jgi:hypothetical protein